MLWQRFSARLGSKRRCVNSVSGKECLYDILLKAGGGELWDKSSHLCQISPCSQMPVHHPCCNMSLCITQNVEEVKPELPEPCHRASLDMSHSVHYEQWEHRQGRGLYSMTQPQPHVPTHCTGVASMVPEKSHPFFAFPCYRAYRKSLTCLLPKCVAMARVFSGNHTRSISPTC